MDYYKILNVNEDSTLKEIEQAYLDLSSFYNPNNNYSKSAYKKYREINEAYEVLKDLKQREIYNLTQKGIVTQIDKREGTLIRREDFNKETSKSNNEKLNVYALRVTVPYIYYLTRSFYKVSYEVINGKESETTCDKCNGEGYIKTHGAICKCPYCLASGHKLVDITRETKDEKVLVDKESYLTSNYLFVFDFDDKDDYKLKDNTITISKKISANEDFKLELDDGNNSYIATYNKDNLSDEFSFSEYQIKVNCTYEDKSIKQGIVVTDKDEIYLNMDDYTFTYKEDDTHKEKVVLDASEVKVNDNLLLVVKRYENNDYNYVFFDKEVVKVNEKLFTKGGYINNKYLLHKSFYVDDECIYLPSKAYKSKLKDYLWFRIASLVLFAILPVLLWLIMGVTSAFFITSFIVLAIYFALVNVLMEVKV